MISCGSQLSQPDATLGYESACNMSEKSKRQKFLPKNETFHVVGEVEFPITFFSDIVLQIAGA